ncbi:MAG: glucose/galactose MFS transporter [[Chlorobium] sp. 445]|nr:MAG: glucose/galactose MFS transporter [[Chlorobium] sp. 445]
MASPNVQPSVVSTAEARPNYTPAFAVVTMLFFMWGFLTCLNDILIPHLKAIFELSYAQAALIQFTFFSAYFIMSLPSGKVIAKVGYKRGIVIGLGTAGIGALLFYPSAAFFSYPLFLTALFVLASGITLLQVAANPYVAVLGRPETASSRLNLAQAFNSLGTTIAPAFGGLLILSGSLKTAEELRTMTAEAVELYKLTEAASVQGPYLGLALALFALAGLIALFNLPVIPTVEGDEEKESAFGEALKQKQLAFGALGIFLYVGAEVSIGSFLVNFLGLPNIQGLKESDAANFVSYYWGGAMVGRFIGSALLVRIKPGTLLGIFAIVAATLVVLALLSSGAAAMWFILSVGLFNSIMFPTIFTLGIDGLGKLTNAGSSLLIMAIVGGALLPVAMGALADAVGLQAAFLLPALCYAYIAYYGFLGSKHK